MKKIILAVTLMVITTSCFAQIVQLYHYCNSETQWVARAALAVDTDVAYNWIMSLITEGCEGISYCDQPVPIEVAEDIIQSDPTNSFAMNIKGWV